MELKRTRIGIGSFTDVEPWVAEIIEKVRPFTMTSNERKSVRC
jgi:hypothetical protein